MYLRFDSSSCSNSINDFLLRKWRREIVILTQRLSADRQQCLEFSTYYDDASDHESSTSFFAYRLKAAKCCLHDCLQSSLKDKATDRSKAPSMAGRCGRTAQSTRCRISIARCSQLYNVFYNAL